MPGPESIPLTPSIRQAHPYRFPVERDDHASHRKGYCYAFHLIDGGRGSVNLGNRAFPLKKGDLVYLPPAVVHTFVSDPEHPLSTYNIYAELWSPTPVDTGIHLARNTDPLDAGLLATVRSDPILAPLRTVIPLQYHPILIDLFIHIVRQYQSDSAYSGAIVRSLLTVLILELNQAASSPAVVDYRIKAILEAIDSGNPASTDCQYWIRRSGLHKTQFHKLFQAATGLPPKAYLLRGQLKQAAVMLRESDRTVTEIAQELGYSSIHHFTRQFTRCYGIAPSAYRRDSRDS